MPTLPASQTADVVITTTFGAVAAPGSETLTLSLVPTTAIPAGAAPDGRRRARAPASTRGPALDVGRVLGGRRDVRAGRHRLRHLGHGRRPGDEHVREGPARRRRPVLLRPRPRRLPELRGQAERVRRALAGRLGRVPDRPARQLVGAQHGHGVDVQARRVPVHERSGGLQRQRRQRPVLVARRRQPPGLRDRAAAVKVDDAPNAPGVQVASSATWVGSNDDVDAARLRGRRLRPRGQDPDGGPARGGRPGPHGPEHHALRQRRQQRERRAAPHRPGPDARRLVGVRQRAVRPVPLGRRDAARLHAAGGPADRGAGRRTCPTRTSTGCSRRRRSRSRRATACRSPAATPAPADDRITQPRRRRWRPASAELDITAQRPGHGLDLPVVGRRGLRSRSGRRAARRPTTRRPTTA